MACVLLCVFVCLCGFVHLNVFVCFACGLLCGGVYFDFFCVRVLCSCLFVCVLAFSYVCVL